MACQRKNRYTDLSGVFAKIERALVNLESLETDIANFCETVD